MHKTAVVKKIIMVISVIAAIAAVFLFLVRPYRETTARHTHERIISYLNNDLSYEEDSYDQYIYDMTQLIELPYITDYDKGHLYERIAQIHKFKGDTISFYHTLGNALYYLNKSEDKSIAVNIYEDIANYYLTDCNIDQAKLYTEKAIETCPLEDIPDDQVKSYAYRMQAIMSVQDGNLEEAEKMIDISNSILSNHTGDLWYESYVSINDMVYASIAYENGNFDEAESILEAYKDSGLFSSPVYADIVTRDFVLPYYNVACKLAAQNGEEDKLLQYLTEYKNASDKFDFRKQEQKLLIEIQEGNYNLSDKTYSEITDRILSNYKTIVETQSNDYAALITEPLEGGINEQAELNASLEAERHKNKLRLLDVIIALTIILIILAIVSHSLRDPLTGVGNRRKMNYSLLPGIIYPHNVSFIMMDIDNFKRVNDTYGHDKGDVVLKRLGVLLKLMHNHKNKAFRYGGEEFVMIVYDSDPSMALRIAENIRRDFQWQKWDFMDGVTISLGVSTGRLSKDTLVEADKNLYYSKEHGKNAVTYTVDGIQKIVSSNN
jgi:diguanylate cyclase (GGDEF)-like protein